MINEKKEDTKPVDKKNKDEYAEWLKTLTPAQRKQLEKKYGSNPF